MRPANGRLDLGQLEVFLEAARTGNHTAAARRLHVTQSAVSHAIRKLEDWYCLYQERAHASREKNRVLADYLLRPDMREFGDAIEGVAPRGRSSTRV